MTRAIRITAGGFLFATIALLATSQNAAAAVVVFDQVTSVGKPVFVKVVTRGLLFTKGGQRVSIQIDKGPVHDTLSGGDGAAYLKFHPEKPGFHPVRAFSEKEEGTGTILVMAPGESIVVIGVEGGLQKSLLSDEKRQEAREVISWLGSTYRLLYLTRWFSVGLVKDWLKKQQFPSSAVIRWRGERTFEQLKKNGVRVEAVVGSRELLQTAPESVNMRFTFDQEQEAAVSGWEEIRKALEAHGAQAKPSEAGRRKKRSVP